MEVTYNGSIGVYSFYKVKSGEFNRKHIQANILLSRWHINKNESSGSTVFLSLNYIFRSCIVNDLMDIMDD